jgi:hypothetical protein
MKNWEVEPSVTYLIRHRTRNLGKKDAQAYRHGFMLGWKKGYDEDLPARYKNNYFWQEGYEAGVAHYCRAKGGPDANNDI